MESLDVVIAAAGCFGISTAVRLPQENGSGAPIYVVIVNNSPDDILYPDSASTDLSKTVRNSYSDPFYPSFARTTVRARTSLGHVHQE